MIVCVPVWYAVSGWTSVGETNQQILSLGHSPRAGDATRLPGFGCVADAVVKHLSEELGDTCVVALIDESGSVLKPMAFAHRDPEASEVFREIIARRSVKVGVGNSGQVAQSGQVINLRDLPGGAVRARIAPEHLHYADAYPVNSMLIVPILSEGRVLGTLGVARDKPYGDSEQLIVEREAQRIALVLERDELAAQLSASKVELDSMFERSQLGLAAADFDGVLTRVNPHFCDIVGRTPDVLMGARLRSFAASADTTLAPRMAGFVANPESARDTFDACLQRPDGSLAWIRVYLSLRTGPGLGDGIWIQIEDATERKVATEELLAADQRFSLAMNNAPIGMALVSLDGSFMEVNESFCRMLGYAQATLVNKSFQEITDPAHLDQDLANVERLIAGEIDDYRMEKRYIRADGALTWGQLHVSLVRDGEGKPQYFVSQIIDVNAAKTAVAELNDAREQFRVLAESASDVVWRVSMDGNVTWVSPSVTAALGFAESDVVGTHVIDLVHFEDQRLVRELLLQVHGNGRAQNRQIRMKTTGEDFRWMAVQARPLCSDAGQLMGAAWGMRDVTDEVAAQEEVERSEQMFRLAMDGAPLGMAVIGLHLRFLRVNSRLCELVGRDRDWLLAHSAAEIFDPGDGTEPLSESEVLLTGGSSSIERTRCLITGSGEPVWVRHSMSLLRDEHGMPLYFVAQFHDITEELVATHELSEKARRDPLTGLFNRETGIRAIRSALEDRAHPGELVGVMFCDLDGFKAINDSFGHQVGDDVLCAATSLISSSVRPGDVVARLGGDEFVVVLDAVKGRDGGQHVAQKVVAVLDGGYWVNDLVRVPTVSVGLCLAEGTWKAEDLLSAADEALYEAKRAGGGQFSVRELSAPDDGGL